MIATFPVTDKKGVPLFDFEFAVSYEHSTIDEGWADGEPLSDEELAKWIHRFGERTILTRAIKPEPDGMKLAKRQRDRTMEGAG